MLRFKSSMVNVRFIKVDDRDMPASSYAFSLETALSPLSAAALLIALTS